MAVCSMILLYCHVHTACAVNLSMTLRSIVQLFIHPGGIKFVLNGIAYHNHSIVSLKDIGEGSQALLCITNLRNCCRRPYTGEMGPAKGNWFFPNGTRVPSSGHHWDFHRTRGQMKVNLQRRRGGAEGIYCCVVPDAMNVTQTIYIGIYTEGKPLLTHYVAWSLYIYI